MRMMHMPQSSRLVELRSCHQAELGCARSNSSCHRLAIEREDVVLFLAWPVQPETTLCQRDLGCNRTGNREHISTGVCRLSNRGGHRRPQTCARESPSRCKVGRARIVPSTPARLWLFVEYLAFQPQ